MKKIKNKLPITLLIIIVFLPSFIFNYISYNYNLNTYFITIIINFIRYIMNIRQGYH